MSHHKDYTRVILHYIHTLIIRNIWSIVPHPQTQVSIIILTHPPPTTPPHSKPYPYHLIRISSPPAPLTTPSPHHVYFPLLPH